MNKNKLDEILNLHKLWLDNDPSGRRADLSGADLWNANLSGAILTGADLSGATLWNANLWNAILSGADLSDAILRNANLTNAKLTNAKLTDTILTNAIFSKNTVFPDGFDPIARGMKLFGEKVLEAPSPTKQEETETAAAVPAAPKTLHEELSEVLAKHGFDLVSLAIQPSKKHTSQG